MGRDQTRRGQSAHREAILAAALATIAPLSAQAPSYDTRPPGYSYAPPPWASVYDTRRPDYVPAAPKNSYTFHIPKIHQKIYKPPDLIMMIDAVSEHYKMDTHLIRAIVHTESSFKHRAVSPKGAIGMMQLMPGTAKRFKVADPHDPIYNVIGGVQYMKWLLLHFNGDHVKAIAAYNAGEGAVEKYNGIPPYSETQAYVPRVMTLWKNKTIQPDPKPAANTASQPPTKQNKTPGRP